MRLNSIFQKINKIKMHFKYKEEIKSTEQTHLTKQLVFKEIMWINLKMEQGLPICQRWINQALNLADNYLLYQIIKILILIIWILKVELAKNLRHRLHWQNQKNKYLTKILQEDNKIEMEVITALECHQIWLKAVVTQQKIMNLLMKRRKKNSKII